MGSSGQGGESIREERDSPDEPEARRKAGKWLDSKLSTRSLPFVDAASNIPASPASIHERTVELLKTAGFRLIDDRPPEVRLSLHPHSRPRAFSGYVAGERALQIDRARTQRVIRRTVALGGLGAGFFVLSFAVLGLGHSQGYWNAAILLDIGGAGGLVGALFSWQGIPSFDSEVLYVDFSGEVPVESDSSTANPEATVWKSRPVSMEIKVGAGRILSANWASKTQSGRSYRAVVRDDSKLAPLSQETLAKLKGS
jgi:hypothetical protein